MVKKFRPTAPVPEQFEKVFDLMDTLAEFPERAREHLEVRGWEVSEPPISNYFVKLIRFRSPDEPEDMVVNSFQLKARLGDKELKRKQGIYLISSFQLGNGDNPGPDREAGPFQATDDLVRAAVDHGLLPGERNQTAPLWWIYRSRLRWWTKKRPFLRRVLDSIGVLQ